MPDGVKGILFRKPNSDDNYGFVIDWVERFWDNPTVDSI